MLFHPLVGMLLPGNVGSWLYLFFYRGFIVIIFFLGQTFCLYSAQSVRVTVYICKWDSLLLNINKRFASLFHCSLPFLPHISSLFCLEVYCFSFLMAMDNTFNKFAEVVPGRDAWKFLVRVCGVGFGG